MEELKLKLDRDKKGNWCLKKRGKIITDWELVANKSIIVKTDHLSKEIYCSIIEEKKMGRNESDIVFFKGYDWSLMGHKKRLSKLEKFNEVRIKAYSLIKMILNNLSDNYIGTRMIKEDDVRIEVPDCEF